MSRCSSCSPRRTPPYIGGMVSLKVGNISYTSRVKDLQRVFCRYGKIGDVYIPRDSKTNNSRGYAFVRFYDKRDAEDALDALDGRMLDGRELRVQMARYGRPASPQRHGRGGRRGRRSRSRSRRRSRSRSRSRRRSRSRSRSERSKSASKSSRGSARKSRSRSKGSDRSRSRSK